MNTLLVRTINDGVLSALEPFLVRAGRHDGRFDVAPFGLRVPPRNRIDPTRLESEPFLNRLCTLDALTFGPEGMPMPRWLFYEASALPGGIFGFGCRAGALSDSARNRLRLSEGYEGLVPLSMYIAIPARPPSVWYGHNLASLNRLIPEMNLKGMASLTKAFALRCFRCRTQIGATQWDSPALGVHTRFGPLELLTAWTPAHAFPATLTYCLRVSERGLRAAMGDPEAPRPEGPEPEFAISSGDEDAMRALQARLEAGERFVITGPPTAVGGRPAVPVAAMPEPAGEPRWGGK